MPGLSMGRQVGATNHKDGWDNKGGEGACQCPSGGGKGLGEFPYYRIWDRDIMMIEAVKHKRTKQLGGESYFARDSVNFWCSRAKQQIGSSDGNQSVDWIVGVLSVWVFCLNQLRSMASAANNTYSTRGVI